MSESYSQSRMSQRTLMAVAFSGAILVLSAAVAGCGAGARPFAAEGGVSAGPGSRLWGDRSSGPDGMEIGCIPGRRFAVVITVRNRTKRTIMLLGADGPSPLPGVIDRAAVQVRLAPPPPKGDPVVIGLRGWSRRQAELVAVPSSRSDGVQTSLLMRNC